MSRLGLLVSFFPALALAVDLAALGWFVVWPHAVTAAAVVLALYGLPLLAYRALTAARPVREGRSRLTGPTYSPWWGAHQVQLVYDAFPALEVPLRLVPGLYSAWLRAWGSRVGRGVYWTPRVEITDRGLLDIGDGAVFGHRAKFFGHLIAPGRGGLILFVKRGRVGAGAFVGAYAVLGPGAEVPAGAVLRVGQHVNTRDRYEGGGEGQAPGDVARPARRRRRAAGDVAPAPARRRRRAAGDVATATAARGTGPADAAPSPDHLFSSPDHLFSSPDHLFSSPDHLFSSPDHLFSSPEHSSSTPEHQRASGADDRRRGEHVGRVPDDGRSATERRPDATDDERSSPAVQPCSTDRRPDAPDDGRASPAPQRTSPGLPRASAPDDRGRDEHVGPAPADERLRR